MLSVDSSADNGFVVTENTELMGKKAAAAAGGDLTLTLSPTANGAGGYGLAGGGELDLRSTSSLGVLPRPTPRGSSTSYSGYERLPVQRHQIQLISLLGPHSSVLPRIHRRRLLWRSGTHRNGLSGCGAPKELAERYSHRLLAVRFSKSVSIKKNSKLLLARDRDLSMLKMHKNAFHLQICPDNRHRIIAPTDIPEGTVSRRGKVGGGNRKKQKETERERGRTCTYRNYEKSAPMPHHMHRI